MPNEYMSISAAYCDAADYPKFDQLKTGYVYDKHGMKIEVERGIPKDAKLQMVIYVYGDESMIDPEIFKKPSQTISTRRIS